MKRRLARICISDTVLDDVTLKGNMAKAFAVLGVVVVKAKHDASGGVFRYVVHSPKLPVLTEGQKAPKMSIMISTYEGKFTGAYFQ